VSIDKLAAALQSVTWSPNIHAFLGEVNSVNQVAGANVRLATWALQFETIDKGNPALSFIRETQVASHHVAALLGLALYKPAAGAMRTAVETALYYSYFRTHPSELTTLARDPNFYVSKNDILDYHKAHTPGFKDLQAQLGVASGLSVWYSKVSNVLHGQVPGTWVTHKSMAEIKFDQRTLHAAVSTFLEGEELIHRFFLCTVARQLWGSVSTSAKQVLLKGLSGTLKTTLHLDSA
jgi:hypothetical protein